MDITFGNPLENKTRGKQVKPALVDFVVSKFSAWSDARSQLAEKWQEYYRIWRCIEDARDQTRNGDTTRTMERSRIKIPVTKEAINNAADAMFQIIFGSRPFFKIKPQVVDLNGMDQASAAQLMESKSQRAKKITNYMRYLTEKERFSTKGHAALIELCVYGTTIGQIVAEPKINRATRKTKTVQPIYAEDNQTVLDQIEFEQIENLEQKVIYPKLMHIPLENFYTDPSAVDIQTAEGCLVRSLKKTFELVKLKQGGVIDRLPEKTGNMNGEQDMGENREERLSEMGITNETSPLDNEILEFWGWVPTEILDEAKVSHNREDGGAEMCIIIANKHDLLKAEPNPHYSGERPFVKGVFEQIPGEFYGSGIVEAAYGPQKALDATVRSRIDNKALAINQVFGINTDKFLPGQNLNLYPGKCLLFRGDPRESLFPLQMPDVTSGSYHDAQEYERYIQYAPGISRMLGGMPAKGGEQTATEVSLLVGQANMRIKQLVKTFEDDYVIPVLTWYSRIILQWMEYSEMFTMLDSKTGAVTFEEITPEDIQEDYEFVAMGSIALNAQHEMQKRIQMLQLTSNPVDMQIVNRPYQIQKIYEAQDLDDTEVGLMLQPSPQQQAMVQQTNQPVGQPGQPGQPGQLPPEPMALLERLGQTNTQNQPGGILEPSNIPGGLPDGI